MCAHACACVLYFGKYGNILLYNTTHCILCFHSIQNFEILCDIYSSSFGLMVVVITF